MAVYEVEVVQMVRKTRTVCVEADNEWTVKEKLNAIYDAVATEDFDTDYEHYGNHGGHNCWGKVEDQTANLKIENGKVIPLGEK